MQHTLWQQQFEEKYILFLTIILKTLTITLFESFSKKAASKNEVVSANNYNSSHNLVSGAMLRNVQN